MSMEEQRQRQEDEARRAQATETTAPKTTEGVKEGAPSEEALLKRALAMSLEGAEDTSTPTDTTTPTTGTATAPDFANMTEEEQIAFAMQMSMHDQRKNRFTR